MPTFSSKLKMLGGLFLLCANLGTQALGSNEAIATFMRSTYINPTKLQQLLEPTLPAVGEPSLQIIDGTPVNDSDYPWMVFVYSYDDPANGGFACGGSLIADKWVVTAAHCTSSSNAVIFAGTKNIEEVTSANVFKVVNRYNHPDYNSVALSSDIAIYELENPVPTSITQKYAELPSVSLSNNNTSAGEVLRVIGWGQTESGESSSELLKADVAVISNSRCSWSVNTKQICAGHAGGSTSCQGDSGGPLLFSSAGKDYVAGLVSYGSSNGCDSAPVVYTRVSSYLDWIESALNGNEESVDGVDEDVTVTELVNGEGIEMSDVQGSVNYYSITVPANTPALISIVGGGGDADLYVRRGSLPTEKIYNCRPYEPGNTESCEIPASSEEHTYFIGIWAFRGYYDVFLKAKYELESDDDDNVNEDGSYYDKQEDLRQDTRLWLHEDYEIPEGVSSLVVKISGGTGDGDLHVNFGSRANTNAYVCRPFKPNSEEECVIENPEPGTWHVGIRAYRAFSGLTLEVSYNLE